MTDSNTTCDSLVQGFTTNVNRTEFIWAEFWYDLSSALTCTCTDNQVNEGFSVRCDFCQLCDPTGICADRFFLYELDANGGILTLEECFTYVIGRDPDTVCLEIEWLPEISDYVCSANVNGDACNSCTYETCSNGNSNTTLPLPIVDCTNHAPGGEILDRCVEDQEKSSPHNGIFTIINDNVFCLPAGDDGIIGGTADRTSSDGSLANSPCTVVNLLLVAFFLWSK